MPSIERGGFILKVVAGEFGDVKGPATTFSPINAAMVSFESGGSIELPFPKMHHVIAYVLEGAINSSGETFEGGNLAFFERNGDSISLRAESKGKLLLLSGEPIAEPVVSYGPFVMNYPGEIKQAILDYEEGKMGTLIS